MADLIKIAEEAFATGKQYEPFKAGDTITVAYKIIEGNKERIQLYRSYQNLGPWRQKALHRAQNVGQRWR